MRRDRAEYEQGGKRHCSGRREEPGSPVLCWKGRWGEERKENLGWLHNGEGTWEGLYVVCRDVCKASLTFNSSGDSSLRSTLLRKTWGLREVQILYVGEHQVNTETAPIDGCATRRGQGTSGLHTVVLQDGYTQAVGLRCLTDSSPA